MARWLQFDLLIFSHVNKDEGCGESAEKMWMTRAKINKWKKVLSNRDKYWKKKKKKKNL